MKKQELIKLNIWDNKIRENTSKISDLALFFLKKDSVFFDIGANTGVFSEQVLAKKNCKAYHFEPIKEYYDYCKIKFQLNKNIKIENYAISDSVGKCAIWMDNKNFGWNTMIKEKTESKMKKFLIKTISFDDYVKKN